MLHKLLQLAAFTGSSHFVMSLLKVFVKRQKQILSRSVNSGAKVYDLRQEYSNKGINEDDSILKMGPIAFFKSWFEEACLLHVIEPNAMCLSTCENNIPTARMVLMKSFDEQGFVWYTNYKSRKGEQLDKNPNAAITFWWGQMERSVRIEGKVEKISSAESDQYFNLRPRGAQIGAWSSNQSSEIDSREQLELHEKVTIAKFNDTSKLVPRPDHWGGYRLIPNRIEFWKGRESRLHDRIVFERRSDVATDVNGSSGIANNNDFAMQWTMKRLQP